MRRNVARIKKIVHCLQQVMELIVDCVEWRSTVRSSLALLVDHVSSLSAPRHHRDDDDGDHDDLMRLFIKTPSIITLWLIDTVFALCSPCVM